MRTTVFLRIATLAVLTIVVACTPSAPTVAPTKPAAAPVPTAAGATPAPVATAAPKPAVTSAPAAAASPSPAAKVKRGGVLVWGDNNHPVSLDPLLEPSGPSLTEMAVGEALVKHEVTDYKAGKLEIRPQLAESWQQPDPKTIVLKLRRGVKFHDGAEFNADVARWNLDRLGSHPKSNAKALVANFDKMEVVDPSTLKITYKVLSALSLLYLTPATGGTGSHSTIMLSKAEMDKVGEEAFVARPSATGPMKITDWKRESEIVTAKFDGYWDKGADGSPLPYLDGIRYRLIRDNAVHLVELKAGTLHVSGGRGAILGASDLPSIATSPELQYMSIPWAANRLYFGYNDKKEPFGGNLKLRQASQWAIDRENMAKVLAGDTGLPNYHWGWIPAWSGYDDTLPKYTFDLNKATALVKEAGYPNRVDILFFHENTNLYQKVGQMVQAMLGKAGIRVTLESQERTANRAKVKAGEFEANIYNLGASPDPAFYNRGFTCEGAANWSNYCNKLTDKCMLDAAAEVNDQKRADLYKQCQRYMYEDALVSGLIIDPPMTVFRKEVKDVKYRGPAIYLGETWLDK